MKPTDADLFIPWEPGWKVQLDMQPLFGYILGMQYAVFITKKALKTAKQMPVAMQQRLALLVEDLRDGGPIRAEWPNYSRLKDGSHHCHLSRKWVACWRMDQHAIIIEVYYAGSRENAPY